MAIIGVPVQFNVGRNTYGSISRLSDNKYVIAYIDDSDGSKGKVVICDRTGMEVSVGEEQKFIAGPQASGNTRYLDCDAVPSGALWPSSDADRIYVYGKDVDGVEGSPGWGIHKCGSISGQTVSWGTPLSFVQSSLQNVMSVTAIGSGHIGCNYCHDDKTICYSTYIDNDNNLTKSSETESETLTTSDNQLQVINPSNDWAVLTYKQKIGGEWYGKSRIIDFTGNIPALGNSSIFYTPGGGSPTLYGMRVCPLSTTKFVLGYSNTGSSSSGYMIVGNPPMILGSVFYGSSFAFASGNSVPYISQQHIGNNRFIFTYSDQSDSSKGKWMVGEVSSNTIIYTQSGVFSEDEIHNDDHASAQCTALTNDIIAISYCKYNSANGYTTILDLATTEFSGSGNLFINGLDHIETSGNLFIHGHLEHTTSSDLFIHGHEDVVASGNLFISGPQPITVSGDLFIHGYNSINVFNDLFVHGYNDITILGNLFTYGHVESIASGSLFIDGWKDVINYSIFLLINGYEPKPALSCPALDPTASIQIKNSLIRIYQSRIDALINQLGKNVYLEFDPVREPCPNCLQDVIRRRSTGIYKTGGPRSFQRGRSCPYCKGAGFLETAEKKCIKSLLKWRPRDAINFGISISAIKGIVRLKTHLDHASDIIRASTALVNVDTMETMKLEVKKIRGPYPVGLRQDKYCISFWQLIDR